MNELEATRAKLKCLEMVEGTDLHWRDVLKLKGCHFNTKSEVLSYPLPFYEFALGVVEGKLVWEGDRLYDSTGIAFAADMIEDGRMHGYVNANVKRVMPIELVSWSPPKPATLMVELPIDVVKSWLNYQSQHEAISAAEFVGKALRKALEQLK